MVTAHVVPRDRRRPAAGADAGTAQRLLRRPAARRPPAGKPGARPGARRRCATSTRCCTRRSTTRCAGASVAAQRRRPRRAAPADDTGDEGVDTEQLRVFLDAVTDDRLYAAWMLMVTTGMRRGEVLGLRWTDVNLDAGRVSVVQTLTVVRRRGDACPSRRRRRAAARSRSTRPRWPQLRAHRAQAGRGAPGRRARSGTTAARLHAGGRRRHPPRTGSAHWFTAHAAASRAPPHPPARPPPQLRHRRARAPASRPRW